MYNKIIRGFTIKFINLQYYYVKLSLFWGRRVPAITGAYMRTNYFVSFVGDNPGSLNNHPQDGYGGRKMKHEFFGGFRECSEITEGGGRK